MSSESQYGSKNNANKAGDSLHRLDKLNFNSNPQAI